MAQRIINLSRDQLSTFLKNQEQIRQFEKIFQVVDTVASAPDTFEISLDAGNSSTASNQAIASIETLARDVMASVGNADNKAVQALDALGRIANALELLATAPSDQPSACVDPLLPAVQQNNSLVTDYIDLPEIGPHVTLPRRIQWNRDDGTMDVGLYGGSVLQVGQEINYYAKNTSGADIANGTPVMFSGTIGASGKLTIDLAVADGTSPAEYMMGVATQDIADNDFGYVTSFGLVRGFDTTGTPYGEVWADGDLLYFDPATPGTWTKTQPQAPNLNIPVAVVINAGSGGSGSIFVRMDIQDALSRQQDVYINSPHDLDLLQYNSTNNRWQSGTNVWVDIDFPIIIRSTGAGIPLLTTLSGNLTMPQWQVNDFNQCESQELIHSWKEGSTIYWHIHMTTNGLEAVAKYVRFELEYGYCNVGGTWTFPAVYTSADYTIPANTPDKTMLIVSITNFTPSLKIGAHVIARLKRVAAVGAAPAADPWIPMLQLHVQLDTLGSRNIGTK